VKKLKSGQLTIEEHLLQTVQEALANLVLQQLLWHVLMTSRSHVHCQMAASPLLCHATDGPTAHPTISWTGLHCQSVQLREMWLAHQCKRHRTCLSIALLLQAPAPASSRLHLFQPSALKATNQQAELPAQGFRNNYCNLSTTIACRAPSHIGSLIQDAVRDKLQEPVQH